MHNLIILGTGRSGTSMVAALFRESGAFFGDRLIPPSRANPHGYYEDLEINDVNTKVIQQMMCSLRTTEFFARLVHPIHRGLAGSWLAAPWYVPTVDIPETIRAPMLRKLRKQPFCFKDPRFSVTLPSWRPWLPADVRFLVVFRDPHRTTDSIIRDASETYDPPLPVTPQWAYLHWWRNYRRLLDQFSHGGDWLFVHYDDVIRGTAIQAIENFADAAVDVSEIDPSVSRARPQTRFSGLPQARRCQSLYGRLCERAAQDLVTWKGFALTAASGVSPAVGARRSLGPPTAYEAQAAGKLLNCKRR